MTLQERLLASAKELVRLLEESQKEHEEKIRERDRKLLCFQVDTGREYKSLAKEVEQREAALMGSEKLKGASHHQCLCPMGLYIDGAKLHQVIRNLELKFQL